jgi:phage FluMu gp28-like protein
MPTISITLPPLHAGQQPIADNPARFRVLACGRRWGKTRLGAALCIKVALEGGRAWWVAPSYKMAQVGWRLINRLAQQITGAEVRRGEMLVTMPSGGEVQVRSADNPDSLRGEGLDFVVMDECAFMQEEAWLEAIRPALSDRLGRAVFISTPKGRNWFWRAFQAGQSSNGEWASWQIPTVDNPHIDAAEVEAARLGLPERVFRQEYLAEFIDDAGGVFRGVMEAATAVALEHGNRGGQYVYGVDWGQQHDFTAVAIMDATTKRLVYLDRFNQIDYNVQRGRLLALAERFPPSLIIAESNSIGLPNIDALQRDGLPIQPFQTTNATKTTAIDALTLAFERHDIQILNDPVLIGELQAYEQERLPSGLRRFSAPPGMHDDTVIALALAWQGVDSAWVSW